MYKSTPRSSHASPRYAIYTRVSTSAQEENGTSLESQLAACRARVQANGGTIDPLHVFTDTASGASWRDRPALQAMLAAMRAREVDVVLAYALDRVSRDQQHLAVIVDLIEEGRARLELVTEDFEQSAVGRFIRSAKAFAAEVEREKITERTVRGKRTRVLSGKVHNHANEMYGYRRDKTLGVRELFEPEAVIVRRIFSEAARGESIRGIRVHLNDDGVPSPAASKGMNYGRETYWGVGVVRRILTEPAYKGEAVAWRWRRVKGGVELRPESEWVHLPGDTTPAIVPPDVWNAVQDRLAKNSGDRTRNETRPYLLRGFVVCAVCGRKMRASPDRGLRNYRCSSRETPAGPCGGKRVNADRAEAWAWDEIRSVLSNPALIAAEITALRDAGPDAALIAERESLARLIDRAERQQERMIYAMRADEAMPLDLFRREIARAEEEKQNYSAALAEVERRLTDSEEAITNLQTVADYCEAVRGNLEDADFELRRLALEAMDAKVRANGSAFTLQLSLPGRNAGTLTTTS